MSCDCRIRAQLLMQAGIVQLVGRGGVPGKLPFGYRASEKRGFPEVCPVEASAVERGLELLISFPVAKTAAMLSAEGFTTRAGGKITAAIVRGMLTNALVVGLIRRRAQGGSDNGPLVSTNERYRIVSTDLWNRAREARGADRGASRAH